MKPAPFGYVAPTTVDEAVAALAAGERDDEVRVLAGGQSLVPLMVLRLARPDTLVDVNGVAELDRVERVDGRLHVGALCRHRRLEHDPDVAALAPLLALAAAEIGHVHIRNRGTFGGSLAHGDPVAELPAALVALDGHIVLRSAAGERRVAAGDFFLGPFMTAVAPGELVTGADVPVAGAGDGFGFAEVTLRHGDFAVVGVAAWLRRDDGGTCSALRLAGCGVGPVPVDLSTAGAAIVGAARLDDDALRAVAAAVARTVDPTGDVHGDAEYRRELAQVLAVRAVRAAWADAADAADAAPRGG
jgi:carbon-monoxide dehydrogenase medium subunit